MRRQAATGIPYCWRAEALYRPGVVDDFFLLHQPQSTEALCVEMARLAYAAFGTVVEPALARAGFGLAAAPFEQGGTQAFLAENGQQAVLVFRGSDDVLDWQNNLNAMPVRWRGAGEVHGGFQESLEAVWPAVAVALRSVRLPLIITGHSLGGALACMAASLVPHERWITFGAPKPGDAVFCESAGDGMRFVNNEDVVCWLPLDVFPLSGVYRHAGTPYLIGPNGGIHKGVDPAALDRPLMPLRRLHRLVAETDSLSRLPRFLMDHAPINYLSALR